MGSCLTEGYINPDEKYPSVRQEPTPEEHGGSGVYLPGLDETVWNMENFDYNETLRRLERIAALVEDPQTGLDDIDRYIREADTLIEQCRGYLRTARERTEKLG